MQNKNAIVFISRKGRKVRKIPMQTTILLEESLATHDRERRGETSEINENENLFERKTIHPSVAKRQCPRVAMGIAPLAWTQKHIQCFLFGPLAPVSGEESKRKTDSHTENRLHYHPLVGTQRAASENRGKETYMRTLHAASLRAKKARI